MKKRLGLVLTVLLALALLLGSCGDATVEEEQETSKTTTTPTTTTTTTPTTTTTTTPTTTTAKKLVENSLGQMVEEPQYGGSVRAAWDRDSLPGFVPYGYIDSYGCLPAYDPLVIADITRGPTGTNDTRLTSTYCPLDMLAGGIAESWEQPDLTTLIFHIRQGVYFHDKPPVNGREVEASDIVWSIDRYQDWPQSEFYVPPDDPTGQRLQPTALDKWTVQVKLPTPDPFRITTVGRNIVAVPHEMDEAMGGMEDWRNECGTGPFEIVDAVTGSSITFRKNSNYWMKDPFFPENTLPYIDEIQVQLIRDPATRLAALRTGKVDQLPYVQIDSAEQLWKSNPELNYIEVPPTGSRCVYLRCNTEPFNDIRVRQAVFMATDFETIKDTMYKGHADVIQWPVLSFITDVYTAPEDLPTAPVVPGSTVSSNELFNYNPEKAMALLADAGYPNGLDIIMYSGPSQEYSETIPVILNYWEAIGINVEVEVMEEAVLWGHTMTVTYPHAARCGWGNANPSWAFDFGMKTGHPWNSSGVVDPYLDSTWESIKAIVDPAERTEQWRDLTVYTLEQAYYYTFPAPYRYNFWQPWIKQHTGETLTARFANGEAWVYYAWIDQSMK